MNPLTETPSYRFDDVVIDWAGMRLEKSGQTRKLTPRAFDVLIYLVQHRGRVVEKQELFEHIWKESFVSDNALTRIVKEVRQVIGDDADAPRYIETVPKRGYRFIANVEAVQGIPGVPGTESPPGDRHSEQVSPAASLVNSPHQVEKQQTRFRRNRTMLIFAAIVVLLLAAVAWLLIRGMLSKSETTSVLSRTQVTVFSGLDIDPSIARDGRAIAYSSDHNGSFEIYVKQLTQGARELQLTSDGEQNFQPAWSPDGQLIAYYSMKRGGIWVVPASGGSARQLVEFGSRPAWSPDGSRIAFQSIGLVDIGATSREAQSPSTLWVISAQGGDAQPITQAGKPEGGHGMPVWSPDGKRIAFEVDNFNSSSIWSISTSGADLQQIVHATDRNSYNPVFAPDGRTIYFGFESGLWRVDISPETGKPTGDPVQIVGAAPTIIRHPSISGDGKRIAYSALLQSSNLWSAPLGPGSGVSGPPMPLTHDNSTRNNLLAFPPDGRKIAYTSWRAGAGGDLWLMDGDGSNSKQLTTNPAHDSQPSWFPNMERIAFLSDRDGRWRLWGIDLSSGRESMLIDFESDTQYVRLSPDGKQVVFNSNKGGPINTWAASLGDGTARQLTFDREMMGFACWSLDGQWLAFEMKRGDDTHIAIMPSGGGPATQLTFDKGQSWSHTWSPDGDKIAFAGFRDGYWNVRWVSRSTREQKQVTSYRKLNAFVRYPAWSPTGDKIVYEYAETTGNIWLIDLK
jgi:Tol biopolymer transport system component/DNA-binding winged helix-turn-helix (wHTH) protein